MQDRSRPRRLLVDGGSRAGLPSQGRHDDCYPLVRSLGTMASASNDFRRYLIIADEFLFQIDSASLGACASTGEQGEAYAPPSGRLFLHAVADQSPISDTDAPVPRLRPSSPTAGGIPQAPTAGLRTSHAARCYVSGTRGIVSSRRPVTSAVPRRGSPRTLGAGSGRASRSRRGSDALPPADAMGDSMEL